MKVKKGDKVLIKKGKDNGKTGVVQRVLVEKNKIVVNGVNIYKKSIKPTQKNPHGGIVDVNLPINASNIRIICNHCDKPARIGYKATANEKMRICKKCKESIDVK